MSDEELQNTEESTGGDKEIDASTILEAFSGEDHTEDEDEAYTRRQNDSLDAEDPWEMDTNILDDENNW